MAQLMFCLQKRNTDKKDLHIYLHPGIDSKVHGFTNNVDSDINEIHIFCGDMNSNRQCAGTIIHEMGHAILPKGNGHNNFWFTTSAYLVAVAHFFTTNRSKGLPVVSIKGPTLQ